MRQGQDALHILIALARRVAQWVDWIEVGTPLIKKHGVNLVTRVKNALPGHVIVADMKTADAGGWEADMAMDAGADVFTVLAAASDATKRNAQLVEFGHVIINLQSSIMSIQNQNASLLRDKDDLEKQLVSMKNWETEKQRYALKPIFENTATVGDCGRSE